MPVPNFKPMPKGLKTLLLLSFSHKSPNEKFGDTGLLMVEERMTVNQAATSWEFCHWIDQHGVQIGHDTIDIRWWEFKHKLHPATQQEVAQYLSDKRKAEVRLSIPTAASVFTPAPGAATVKFMQHCQELGLTPDMAMLHPMVQSALSTGNQDSVATALKQAAQRG